MVVVNDPAHEFAGIDDQLDRAIAEIKVAMARQPVHIPTPPPNSEGANSTAYRLPGFAPR